MENQIKITLAQLNLTVGDIEGNTQKIITAIDEAEKKYLDVPQPNLFALKPTDFFGIAPIPKLKVNEGFKYQFK